MKNDIHNRKLQHIDIVLKNKVEPQTSSLNSYRLPYIALPELDLEEIDTRVSFFNKKLSFPFIVASMTGGAEKVGDINKNLAIACEKEKVALALGSMRIVLKDKTSIRSFDIRSLCPSIPIFANMGLVQLNYGYGAKEINTLIDSIDADGIFLHVNHMQEAIQPEGDTNFKDLIPKLERILPKIKRRVIIKEVGTGIDRDTALKLSKIGIEWIDVSGMGGTSWTSVEAYRRSDDLGFIFEEVGIPLDMAIIGSSDIKGLNIIASGGIRSGLDMAKSIALGASMTSVAKPLLEPALASSIKVSELINKWRKELRIAMFASGVKNIKDLKKIKLIKINQ